MFKSSERQDSNISASKNLGEQHNIRYYEEGMRRHIDKKLAIFEFIPEDVTIFLDIGCATGELLARKRQDDRERSRIDGKARNYTYIGVDISPSMIDEANRQHEGTGIIFTTSLPEAIEVVQNLRLQGGKSAMTLSAVLHEVIHYQPEHEHAAFWHAVWHESIDYVAIRDFSVDENLETKRTKAESVAWVRNQFKDIYFPVDHPLGGKHVLDVWERGYDAVNNSQDPLLAKPFSGWGSINKSDSFTHFLMTVEYLRLNDPDNYGRGIRELHENYMSLPFPALCKTIPTCFSSVHIQRGITKNRYTSLLSMFGSDILSEVTPTKGIFVFKQRRSPELYLKDEDNYLCEIHAVDRILMEHCLRRLTTVIGLEEGSVVRVLQSQEQKSDRGWHYV
ncbi:MAG: class I SAM-dependent methyltransferase [Legionellaceae bacterium]|nr:class I SAM-dependent methyltransferase [Legionellaceae bacterium]